jgi:imidazole glycerol phosphate synthase glutamine amidotransferase subunit
MSARILIVDDEEIVIRSCLRILGDGGYELESAEDGWEALKKIEENHYDVLVLDIMMPKIDGLEVLRRVKESHPDIDVIMITGLSQIDTAVRAMKLGAFGDGMAALRKQGLVDGLHRHAVRKKKPLLGICLGMQLLAEVGEEHGVHEGLGYVKGHVVRLNATEAGCRVPNMGWCDVTVVKPGGLLEGVRDGESFYFAHSYYLECADRQDIAATIQYSGRAIPAAIERENLPGVQFHPEKSQDVGLEVLDSFFRYLGSRASA